jgi:hypothetical protein
MVADFSYVQVIIESVDIYLFRLLIMKYYSSQSSLKGRQGESYLTEGHFERMVLELS